MKKHVYLLSFIIYLLLCSYFVYTILSNVYIGINVKHTAENTWIVSNIKKNSWADYNNIQIGQEILKVNQIPIGDYFTVKAYGAIGKANTLQIIDNGIIKNIDINNNFTDYLFYFHLIISLIFICIACFFSWYLIRKHQLNKTNQILMCFFNLFGISFLAAVAAVQVDIIAQFTVMVGLVLLPILFLNFLNNYLIEKYQIKLVKDWILYSLYLLCGIIFILKVLLVSLSFGHYFALLTYIVLFSFAIIVLVDLCAILLFYIKIRNTTISPVFKIIIAAILLSFSPFLLGNMLPTLIFDKPFIIGEVATVFMYILPITLFYLITTDQLIDIDFLIKKFYFYFIFSLVFVAIIEVVLSFVAHFTAFQYAQLFLFLLSFMIIFLYAKDWLEHKFRHRLFPQKNHLQIRAQNFVRFMSKVMKKSEFNEYLIEEVKNVLSVREAKIIEFPKNTDDLVLKENLSIEIYSQLQANIYNVAKLYKIKSGYYSVIGETSDYIYVLAIGHKKNGVKLNQDEEEWLTTIAYLTYITYENLHHIDELFKRIQVLENENTKQPWLSRLLFHIQETERRKLANDLHDTILQEQLVLLQKVGFIINKKQLEKDVLEKLLELKEGFLDLIYEIRETCYELRPPFLLEIGLVKALNNYIEKVQLRNDFIVEFDHKNLSVQLDDECTSHLYRIVQELLNNASKHSEASLVKIDLYSENETVYLNYEDNGKGIKDLLSISTSGRIGLSGIKERVHSLEGTIEIAAKENQGLEIKIAIPLNKNPLVIL